ncbi:phosphatidylinositol-glycan biosynthesis class X protein [Arapaima gigas]
MEVRTNVVFFCFICLSLWYHGEVYSGGCGFSEDWLMQVTVSAEIQKSGFHRELVLSVHCAADVPDDLQALLLQRLPGGIYIDSYQLSSLQQDRGLQVLLDSEIDLEAPAYSSSGFPAFVFPTRDVGDTNRLWAKVPIHGRYQRPSGSGQKWEQVYIEAPQLLLRFDLCKELQPLPPHKLVEAPCSALNISMCIWLKIHHWQDQQAMRIEIPVGHQHLMVPVCAGTLLVTLLCFGLIARAVLAHGFSQP